MRKPNSCEGRPMRKLYINTIVFNKSLVDGPGVRTLVFFQGCDIHCPFCQNQSTWDMKQGKEISVEELAKTLIGQSFNKKVTITGGEPLLQKEGLSKLVKILDENGFDIALYTGHQRHEVPSNIIAHLTYLKYGPFIQEEKTTVKPYVGSRNQTFEKLR